MSGAGAGTGFPSLDSERRTISSWMVFPSSAARNSSPAHAGVRWRCSRLFQQKYEQLFR